MSLFACVVTNENKDKHTTRKTDREFGGEHSLLEFNSTNRRVLKGITQMHQKDSGEWASATEGNHRLCGTESKMHKVFKKNL